MFKFSNNHAFSESHVSLFNTCLIIDVYEAKYV